MRQRLVKTSKFLSYVLRHKPESIGLTLDREGWAHVDDLIRAANDRGRRLTFEILREVVETNDKKRFSFSDDETRIRANQGHSIDVDLGLQNTPPPEFLYHGTASRFLDSIFRKGLHPRGRHHVHLSPDIETATRVGTRHGKPIVLQIDSARMHRDGRSFFLSKNGVWLVDRVEPTYLKEMG